MRTLFHEPLDDRRAVRFRQSQHRIRHIALSLKPREPQRRIFGCPSSRRAALGTASRCRIASSIRGTSSSDRAEPRPPIVGTLFQLQRHRSDILRKVIAVLPDQRPRESAQPAQFIEPVRRICRQRRVRGIHVGRGHRALVTRCLWGVTGIVRLVLGAIARPRIERRLDA